jgi:hypothetical protein
MKITRPIRPDELPDEFLLREPDGTVYLICKKYIADGADWIQRRIDRTSKWSRSLDGPWLPFTVEEEVPSPGPLGPEDVPPGSVIRHNEKTMHWSMVTCVKENGIYAGHTVDIIGFEWLKQCFEISRDNGKTWQKCQKEGKII